ncbi:hypothetical protein B0O80DRAFT_440868 [Mortierella sp. GBAus27b]|nr:hypothetical protein B0O80DRAFT_440868 [Mortierella sp. GBAus27b]
MQLIKSVVVAVATGVVLQVCPTPMHHEQKMTSVTKQKPFFIAGLLPPVVFISISPLPTNPNPSLYLCSTDAQCPPFFECVPVDVVGKACLLSVLG